MEAMLDLETVLRVKKEGITPQEAHLMKASQDRARRRFYVGCMGGSLATYLVTKRLPKQPRFALSAAAGLVSGFALLVKSLESSVEHLLSLQGTRIQGELAHIMLKKRQNDPWVRQRISKYFYPEVVYNDYSADRPLYRWRYRNIYEDTVTPQSSSETDSKENDVKMTTEGTTKQVHASAGGDTVENERESAFDLVFGVPESAEDDSLSDAPTPPSRRQTRREKRTRRRHRHARHDDESEI